MKTIIVLSTLFCLSSAFFVRADNAACCLLKETWISENGVSLELDHHPDGTLTGTYMDHSASQEERIGKPIHGQAGKGKPATFGFVVSMKDGSTKVWSGQYQFCKGEAMLLARWMMSSATTSCRNDWRGHFSGVEKFVRKSSLKHGSKLGRYIRREFRKVLQNQAFFKQ